MPKTYADILRDQVDALESEREALNAELNELAADESRSAEDIESRATEITERAQAIKAEVDAKLERIGELDALAEERRTAPKGPEFIRKEDPATPGDVRAMNVTQLTDVVKRGAEERDIDPTHAVRTIRRYRNSQRAEVRAWMENLAARSTDVYTSAWAKLMCGREATLTDAERASVAVGTNTQGGYLVPTHLDPTIILTNDGSSNTLRQISRVVTQVVGNTWRGASSSGVTASFDAELAEVSDDSPGFGGPTVPLYTARAFAGASIEAFEDIDSLASDVLMLFADARDRLEGSKHAVGAGSTEPTGIFTAITGSQGVLSGTAATITLIDLLGLRRSLGVRFRNKSAWVYNPVYGDAIRQLGTALSANYTVNANEGNTERLLNRPVYETDDAPSTQTTTVKDPEIMIGDFDNFVIADKPGSMSVQFIPVMFNTATNLPTGGVGWFAHWRNGSDSVNDAAFRVLLDKTSA